LADVPRGSAGTDKPTKGNQEKKKEVASKRGGNVRMGKGREIFGNRRVG